MSLLTLVPTIVPTLVIVVAIALMAADVLHAHPLPFYIAAWAAAALTFVPAPPLLAAAASVISSCYVGVAMYLVVMFAGALPKRWPFTKRRLSIRSELSIVGGIFVFAHVCRVLAMVPLSFSEYWPLIWQDAALPMLIACGVVGPLLLVCFAVPWVTSFKCARKRMSFSTWKRIQKLAYPFMALMILQGVFLGIGHAVYLGPASPDFAKYAATAAVYVALGITYLVLKLVQKHRRKDTVSQLPAHR